MPNSVSLSDTSAPILRQIGYDFARLRELTDDDVVTVFSAHVQARKLLVTQLVTDLGDAVVADRVLTHARQLPCDKQRKRRALFADAVEANRKPKPRLLAAHIAYALDIEYVLAVELQRRARPTSVN